jgi:hypothetical protein
MGFWKFIFVVTSLGAIGASTYVAYIFINATTVTRASGFTRAPNICPCTPAALKSGVHVHEDNVKLTPIPEGLPRLQSGEDEFVDSHMVKWGAEELVSSFIEGAQLVKGWVPLYGTVLYKSCCRKYSAGDLPFIVLGRTADWIYHLGIPTDGDSMPGVFATRAIHCALAPPTGVFVPSRWTSPGVDSHPGHYTVEISARPMGSWDFGPLAPGVVVSLKVRDLPGYGPLNIKRWLPDAIQWGYAPVFTENPTPEAGRRDWLEDPTYRFKVNDGFEADLIVGRTVVGGVISPGMNFRSLSYTSDEVLTIATGMPRVSPHQVEICYLCATSHTRAYDAVAQVVVTNVVSPTTVGEHHKFQLEALCTAILENARKAMPLVTRFFLCLHHMQVKAKGTVLDETYSSGCKCIPMPGRAVFLGSCEPEEDKRSSVWMPGVSKSFAKPVVSTPPPVAKQVGEPQKGSPSEMEGMPQRSTPSKAPPVGPGFRAGVKPPSTVKSGASSGPPKVPQWVSMPSHGLRCGLYGLVCACVASGMSQDIFIALMPEAVAELVKIVTANPQEETPFDSMFSADRLVGIARVMGLHLTIYWGENFTQTVTPADFETKYRGSLRLDTKGAGHYYSLCNESIIPLAVGLVDSNLPAIEAAIAAAKVAVTPVEIDAWSQPLNWVFSSTGMADPDIDTSYENCLRVMANNSLICALKLGMRDEVLYNYFLDRGPAYALNAAKEVSNYGRKLSAKDFLEILRPVSKPERLTAYMKQLDSGPAKSSIANTVGKALNYIVSNT